MAEAGPGRRLIRLLEGLTQPGRHHGLVRLWHIGERVPGPMHPAPLPGGAQHPPDRGLEALMRVRDHQLHAAKHGAPTDSGISAPVPAPTPSPTPAPTWTEPAATDTINGTSGNDVLTGTNAANKIVGGTGNDRIAGKLGSDALFGGTGADTFVFDTALGSSNVDSLMDFTPGTDKIQLSSDIFKSLWVQALGTDVFKVGTAAADHNDHIVYNQTTGGKGVADDGAHDGGRDNIGPGGVLMKRATGMLDKRRIVCAVCRITKIGRGAGDRRRDRAGRAPAGGSGRRGNQGQEHYKGHQPRDRHPPEAAVPVASDGHRTNHSLWNTLRRHGGPELAVHGKVRLAHQKIGAARFEFKGLLLVALGQNSGCGAERRRIDLLLLFVDKVEHHVRALTHEFGLISSDLLDLPAIRRSVRMGLRQGQPGSEGKDCERKNLRKLNRGKVDTREFDEQIRELSHKIADLRGRAASARKRAREEAGEKVRALEVKRRAEVKLARQESGLWWGNYNAVVKAYERGRRVALRNGGQMQFKRYDGTGRFVNQIQGGMTVADLFGATHSQVTVEALPENAWTHPSRGERRRLQRTRLTATILVTS
ncbi:hypothetical protein VOLCADRAFT_101201, partial [Volvox carteri f. nagariensis]